MEKNFHILIVDCDSSFCVTSRKIFESSFHVTLALTAEDGFKQIDRDTPDIIMLGYLKPRGTSRQFANKLAENQTTTNIPILVVDVSPEEYSYKGWRWSDGFGHNIKGYLWRPIDALELKNTITGVLQRRRAGAMNLTEVAQQTEEMLKRIDQLKKLLMLQPESK